MDVTGAPLTWIVQWIAPNFIDLLVHVVPKHSIGLPYMPISWGGFGVNVGIYGSPMECLGFIVPYLCTSRSHILQKHPVATQGFSLVIVELPSVRQTLDLKAILHHWRMAPYQIQPNVDS